MPPKRGNKQGSDPPHKTPSVKLSRGREMVQEGTLRRNLVQNSPPNVELTDIEQPLNDGSAQSQVVAHTPHRFFLDWAVPLLQCLHHLSMIRISAGGQKSDYIEQLKVKMDDHIKPARPTDQITAALARISKTWADDTRRVIIDHYRQQISRALIHCMFTFSDLTNDAYYRLKARALFRTEKRFKKISNETKKMFHTILDYVFLPPTEEEEAEARKVRGYFDVSSFLFQDRNLTKFLDPEFPECVCAALWEWSDRRPHLFKKPSKSFFTDVCETVMVNPLNSTDGVADSTTDTDVKTKDSQEPSQISQFGRDKKGKQSHNRKIPTARINIQNNDPITKQNPDSLQQDFDNERVNKHPELRQVAKEARGDLLSMDFPFETDTAMIDLACLIQDSYALPSEQWTSMPEANMGPSTSKEADNWSSIWTGDENPIPAGDGVEQTIDTLPWIPTSVDFNTDSGEVCLERGKTRRKRKFQPIAVSPTLPLSLDSIPSDSILDDTLSRVSTAISYSTGRDSLLDSPPILYGDVSPSDGLPLKGSVDEAECDTATGHDLLKRGLDDLTPILNESPIGTTESESDKLDTTDPDEFGPIQTLEGNKCSGLDVTFKFPDLDGELEASCLDPYTGYKGNMVGVDTSLSGVSLDHVDDPTPDRMDLTETPISDLIPGFRDLTTDPHEPSQRESHIRIATRTARVVRIRSPPCDMEHDTKMETPTGRFHSESPMDFQGETQGEGEKGTPTLSLVLTPSPEQTRATIRTSTTPTIFSKSTPTRPGRGCAPSDTGLDSIGRQGRDFHPPADDQLVSSGPPTSPGEEDTNITIPLSLDSLSMGSEEGVLTNKSSPPQLHDVPPRTARPIPAYSSSKASKNSNKNSKKRKASPLSCTDTKTVVLTPQRIITHDTGRRSNHTVLSSPAPHTELMLIGDIQISQFKEHQSATTAMVSFNKAKAEILFGILAKTKFKHSQCQNVILAIGSDDAEAQTPIQESLRFTLGCLEQLGRLFPQARIFYATPCGIASEPIETSERLREFDEILCKNFATAEFFTILPKCRTAPLARANAPHLWVPAARSKLMKLWTKHVTHINLNLNLNSKRA